MRNLWNLLVQYHIALVFVIFQGIALTWFVGSHGYSRGKWVQRSLEWQGKWDQRISQWNRLTELDGLNRELLAENATLRAELHSARGDAIHSTYHGAEVIRSTWNSTSNQMVLNKGTTHGVKPGNGLLQNNRVVGRVVEASENYALALPLINSSIEWSVRIGSSGPVARLVWEGGDVTRATVYDVPRSAPFSPGDSVLSSGFQGYFPAGLLVGSIADEAPEFDGQFLNVPITLAADFRAIRYVQIAAPLGESEINGLSHSDSQQSP